MNEKIPFQYCLLQYRHDLVTGEFLNVGLALYSKPYNYFNARLLTKYRRISCTFPGMDGEFYKKYMTYLQLRLDAIKNKIKSEQLLVFDEWPNKIEDLVSKVLPVDDSSIYFDTPRGGVAKDLDKIFDELYSRLVERYLSENERSTRMDDDVWNVYRQPLLDYNVLPHLERYTVETSDDEIEFHHGWKNGRWNILQPLSFDLSSPTYIKKKAREWLGTTIVLDKSKELSHLYLLLGKPSNQQSDLIKAYNQTKDILNVKPANFRLAIIEEDAASDFAKEIRPVIERDLKIKI
jgi:hypothetical protein